MYLPLHSGVSYKGLEVGGGRDGSRRGLKISAGGATLCPLESARNIAKNGQG